MSHTAYSPSVPSGAALLALASVVDVAGISGVDPQSRTRWFHVAPFGEWAGHGEGSFVLDKRHFDSVVRVIREKRTPCSVDYEHASIRPRGEPTPASGYVLTAEVRADGLWALVECTERNDKMIRAGEYRFCSGVFSFSSVDPISAEPLLCVLDSIAMTNRPFIDGQRPIACTRSAASYAAPRVSLALATGASKMKITRKALDKLLDALGLREFTPAQLAKAVEFLSADDAEPAPEAAEPAAEAELSKPVVALSVETPAAIVAPVVALTEEPVAPADPPLPPDEGAPAGALDALLSATGLDAAGLEAAIAAHLDALVAVLSGDPGMAASAALTKDLAVDSLRGSVVALTKTVNEYRARDTEATAKALDLEIDAMIKAGKIHPAKRAEVAALARKTPDGFRSLASALTVTLPTAPHASALSAPTPGSERLADDVCPLPADHPRVIALSAMLTGARVAKDSPSWKRAMSAVRPD